MIKFYLPFILQSLLMIVDEFYFHRKRQMPKWELIGHPLDSVTVLIPLALPVFITYHPYFDFLFISLAFFSCIFVTKDEFVHADLCSKTEQWLHALLFILHPLIFLCTYLLWTRHPDSPFLVIQLCLVSLFLFYQIINGKKGYGHVIKN